MGGKNKLLGPKTLMWHRHTVVLPQKSAILGAKWSKNTKNRQKYPFLGGPPPPPQKVVVNFWRKSGFFDPKNRPP